ncbi:unnamed protein product, partial [Didymodactylos carnosus]
MSDESYSPESDLSVNNDQDNPECSPLKKYNLRTTGVKCKRRYSTGGEIISASINRSRFPSRFRSYSASDSHRPGSVSGSPQYRSRSETKLSSSMTRVKQLQCIKKTVQMIDVGHLQEQLNTAHVCPGARLKFIPDTDTAVGLFHRNSLECSKCHKHTDAPNFPPKYPIESTVHESNARLYAVSAATDLGYEAISTLMSSLCLSITTKKHFIEQTHKVYSTLHEFAQKKFHLLINNIRQSANIHDLDSILNVYASLDGTWKRRGHISNYGIVFLIHVEIGYCIDYEVLSLRCETCDAKKSQLTMSQLAEGASRIFQR